MDALIRADRNGECGVQRGNQDGARHGVHRGARERGGGAAARRPGRRAGHRDDPLRGEAAGHKPAAAVPGHDRSRRRRAGHLGRARRSAWRHTGDRVVRLPGAADRHHGPERRLQGLRRPDLRVPGRRRVHPRRVPAGQRHGHRGRPGPVRVRHRLAAPGEERRLHLRMYEYRDHGRTRKIVIRITVGICQRRVRGCRSPTG